MAMKRNAIVAAVVAALVLSACGSDKKTGSPTTVKGNGGGVATVSIVASLQGAVITLMQGFNKANPASRVPIPPAKLGSGPLAASVARGKPGVYILPTVAIRKLAAGATKASFGRKVAVIAVSNANPKHVTGLNAFAATSHLKVAACGARLPFGNGPGLVLLKAKIVPAKGTVIFDCTKVMKDLASGKLDAALVYRDNLFVPKDIKLITVPDAQNLIGNYSIVLVGKSPKVAAFGKFVASPTGQSILKLRGYLP
jgi:ABC-type molybdate transport system substrate-binding protein